VFRRVSRTLLHEDWITFAVRLAQIRLRGGPNELEDDEFDFLLKVSSSVFFLSLFYVILTLSQGGENVTKPNLPQLASLLDARQQCYLQELGSVSAFSKLKVRPMLGKKQKNKIVDIDRGQDHMLSDKEGWSKFLSSPHAEVPQGWEQLQKQTTGKQSEIIASFRRLLLLKGAI
jgi:hypothetical protein